MAHDTVLRNGLIVTPSGMVRGGVAIDGPLIADVGPDVGRGTREIDLDGRVVLPGLMDPHVHFGLGDVLGDAGLEADFASSSKDCVIGGVTTIATTTTVGSDPLAELFERALRCGEGRSHCDFKFDMPVISRAQIDEIPALVARGAVSFKFFTGYEGEQAAGFGMNPEGIPPDFFQLACERLREAGPPAFAKIHAEEPTVREMAIERHRRDPPPAGEQLRAWADASPSWGEAVQVYTYGQIAASLGVPLYAVHVSLGHTVELIRRMQRDGAPVIGETLVLFLSTTAQEMDAKGMGAKAKIQPPIRHQADRDALWQGIEDGTMTIVGTDSLCYSRAFKEEGDFWDSRVGVNPQYADTIPLMLRHLLPLGVERGFESLARLCSENAARRYGIHPRKGAIAPGSDADLVVVDPERRATLGVDRYRGMADYSLWEGMEVTGMPVMTLLRGRVVAEEGEIVAEPGGAFVSGGQG